LLDVNIKSITHTAARYGQHRLTRRFPRLLPWIGGAIALLTLAAAIRRKGVIGGTLDTALNAVPFVGGVKILTEAVRGRDFIRPRSVTQ
jgi:hypothetical protein